MIVVSITPSKYASTREWVRLCSWKNKKTLGFAFGYDSKSADVRMFSRRSSATRWPVSILALKTQSSVVLPYSARVTLCQHNSCPKHRVDKCTYQRDGEQHLLSAAGSLPVWEAESWKPHRAAHWDRSDVGVSSQGQMHTWGSRHHPSEHVL